MKGRHAFLILAHESPEMLRLLVSELDHERSDVFVHLDAKSDALYFPLSMSRGRLQMLSNRVDCRWGDFSIVEAEFRLIEAALEAGEFDYLHIISGVDFPLHGVEHIFGECERLAGKEFIGFSQGVSTREIRWRTGRRFLFPRDLRTRKLWKRLLNKIYTTVQYLPGLNHKIDAEVKKGPQWCSFTADFARELISRREWIAKSFRATFCPDEHVVQTVAWNSPFRERLFSTTDEFGGARRFIPWVNGKIQPLGACIGRMKSSTAFFGRKFTSETALRLKEKQ